MEENVRTCLACRKKAMKPELYRFVRALDGEICFDAKARLPHRGVWICAKKVCLEKAFTKRLLFRDERTLPVDNKLMLSTIKKQVKSGILARLGLMRRLGQIEMGRDAVKRSMMQDNARAVIFAHDISKRSQDEFDDGKLRSGSIPLVMSPLLMEEIGSSLGRGKTGVVALLESRIKDEILLQIDKLKDLET